MGADLRETVDQLESQVEGLGLITIREAADVRGCSRSAILQLLQRNRLKSENILGKTYLYRAEVEGFERRRPGPAANTVYKRRAASDNGQAPEAVATDEVTAAAPAEELIETN